MGVNGSGDLIFYCSICDWWRHLMKLDRISTLKSGFSIRNFSSVYTEGVVFPNFCFCSAGPPLEVPAEGIFGKTTHPNSHFRLVAAAAA